MCDFCMRKNSAGMESGKNYPIHPCANGDLGVRAMYLDGGIILLKDRNIASGYFDVNYCPICGRRVTTEADPEPVPVLRVLEDMYNPNGGIVAMAAKDYYYQNYASEEERKKMDRDDKILTIIGIILFVFISLCCVGFWFM